MTKNGNVRFFDLKKRFGFLMVEDGPDVYFNWDSFSGDATKNEMINLTNRHKEGKEPSVTFTLKEMGEGKVKAANIRQA